MNVEVEKITPELAKKYLANNKINRGLNKNSVAKYATSMQEGRWKLNGEPIQFNCDGTLINGQHRLQACVRADTSFDTLVARGIPQDCFDTIDTGKVRSNGDVLYIKGEANATALGRVLTIVAHYASKSTKFASRFDNDVIWRLLDKFPSTRDSVGKFAGKKPPFNDKFLIALHFLANKKHPDEASVFFDGVLTGANLNEESPALLLRQAMYEWIANKDRKRSQVFRFAVMIKAWNAFITEKPVKQLRFGEKMNEEFPRVM